MLIGLHGKKRSGKDTACEFMLEWAESQGRVARRDAFADRLKISAARALGFEGPDFECVMMCEDLKQAATLTLSWDDDALPENVTWQGWSITGREYLQLYGTEAHREVFDEDFWINGVMNTYAPGEILIVTDVRFPNEGEAIRAAGGEVWQILRPGNVDADDSHASEQPLPTGLIDQVVINDRDLDHLRDLVVSRIERLVYA